MRIPQLIALVGLGALVAAQEVPDTTLRVSVRLVNVVATVRDLDGRLTRNLSKEDFEILEEGAVQQIRVFERESEMPLSIAVLLDASLSTAKDLKLEQDSAIRFVQRILRAQDRGALFTFTHDVFQVAPFTSSITRLEKALRSVRPAGGTSLFDAIYLASGELRKQKGRKAMLIISDGGDTTSTTGFHDALRAAQQADAVIYCVVIVPIPGETGRNVGGEHTLQLLSEGTGGRFFRPNSAAELDPALDAVREEISTQYVLGFYAAPDVRSGLYRRIEVRAKNPDFTVRARKGYYLTEATQ